LSGARRRVIIGKLFDLDLLSQGQNLKKQLRFWIGVAISLVGLWLALRGVEFSKLGATFSGANYWWLIPALLFHLMSLVGRSERWRVLLGTDKVDSVTAFLVMNLGYLISNVLPLRVGDPARAIIVDQRSHTGIPRGLSTVVVERVFDVLAVVVGLVLLVPFMQLPPDAMRWVRVFGALGLLAVLGIVALLTQRALAERILTAVLSRIPRLSPDKWLMRWRNLMSGFDALGSVRGVVIVIGWTLVVWIGAAGIFWGVMRAFIPNASVVAATFLLCIESFGMAVPATPGNWGVYEAIAKVGLVVPFGYPVEQAVSFALAVHLFEYLLLNLVGVIALMRYSLSLGDITAKAESVERGT
jgi:glycosyltransferase 2 family protein